MGINRLTDSQIREKLEEIDEDDDLTVTAYEADFLNNIMYSYQGPLSEKQREVALRMIAQYLDEESSDEVENDEDDE
jgi:hypothetical protein